MDRTDFSDKHLQEDGPIGPHEDVDPASLMPNLADEGSASPHATAKPTRPSLSCASRRVAEVPVGVASELLVSLSNLGSKMFNVTSIDGYIASASSGKKLKASAPARTSALPRSCAAGERCPEGPPSDACSRATAGP